RRRNPPSRESLALSNTSRTGASTGEDRVLTGPQGRAPASGGDLLPWPPPNPGGVGQDVVAAPHEPHAQRLGGAAGQRGDGQGAGDGGGVGDPPAPQLPQGGPPPPRHRRSGGLGFPGPPPPARSRLSSRA